MSPEFCFLWFPGFGVFVWGREWGYAGGLFLGVGGEGVRKDAGNGWGVGFLKMVCYPGGLREGG